MKLVHDVPGSRLTLAGEPFKVPWLLAGLVGFLVLPFLTIPLGIVGIVWQGGDLPSRIVGGFIALLLLSVGIPVLLGLRRAARRPSRIDVDRNAGEVRIGMTAVIGGATRESVTPLERLRAASVRRVAGTGGKAGQIVLELRSRRESENPALESRRVSFTVEHLDKNEEVADLALRIAAAARLPFLRVVRNDEREVEVELQRDPEPGFSHAPSSLGAANYASDVVAPAARSVVAQEKVAAFEPQLFKSDHRVDTWTPGVFVRFRKPWSFVRFGCLPFTLLVFLGPAAFFGLELPELLPRMLVSLMATIFGLIFGAVAIAVVWDAFPRRTDIDWRERRITLKTVKGAIEIPFETLQAIELKAVHHVSRGKNSTTHSYQCEIRALLHDGNAGADVSQELVSTERLVDNPDEPYRMALPLATELAKALKVERRFIDYD